MGFHLLGGRQEDKWIPLVPIEDHDELPREFLDENGVLRAAHKLICSRTGGDIVSIRRFAAPVFPDQILDSRWRVE